MMQLKMLLNVFSLLVSIFQFFYKMPFQQVSSWILTMQRELLLDLQENSSSFSSSWPYIVTKLMERGVTSQLLLEWRQLGNSWTCWFRAVRCCYWIHGRDLVAAWIQNPWRDPAWKGPPCAWEWRGRAVGECRIWGAAGWKAVAPLAKHSTSSVVFTNYEHISANVTAATELWGLDITNKQDGILLILAWSVSPLGSCSAETLSPCSTTLHSHSSSHNIRCGPHSGHSHWF